MVSLVFDFNILSQAANAPERKNQYYFVDPGDREVDDSAESRAERPVYSNIP